MEQKELPVKITISNLANTFLNETQMDKNSLREDFGKIIEPRYRLTKINSENRQSARNKILKDIKEKTLPFKHLVIMFADNHPLLNGWSEEYEIKELDSILQNKIQDFEGGEIDPEIYTPELQNNKTKENLDKAIAPYRKFKESLKEVISPPIYAREAKVIEIARDGKRIINLDMIGGK